MADMNQQILELVREVVNLGNRMDANLAALTTRVFNIEDITSRLASVVERLEANEKLIIQLLQRREGGEASNGAE